MPDVEITSVGRINAGVGVAPGAASALHADIEMIKTHSSQYFFIHYLIKAKLGQACLSQSNSLKPFELAQISNPIGQPGNLPDQRQAVFPDGFVLGHDQHLVEKLIDGRNKLENDFQELIYG